MASYYVTPAGSIIDNGSKANPFDWASFRTWCQNAAAAGDVAYLLSGTYACPTSLITARDGGPATPIQIVGVTDFDSLAEADGTDRPLINGAANQRLEFDNYWHFRNLRLIGDTGSGVYLLRADLAGTLSNVYIENTGLGSCFRCEGTDSRHYNCEGTCPAGVAFFCNGGQTHYLSCFAHDAAHGFYLNNQWQIVLAHCVATDITNKGIRLGASNECAFIHNTFYNCLRGLSATGAGARNTFLANIMAGCTTPAEWTAAQPRDLWDWNCWWNSGTPTNVTKGPNAINQDPMFVDATAGTIEGLQVRNAALRQQGMTLSTIGAIAPSIYDTGPSLSAPAGSTDLSGEQELLDGTETINLDGIDIPYAYRHREDQIEGDPTEGVYLMTHVQWDLPPQDAYYAGGNKPTVGGIITDGDGRQYVIQGVKPPRPFEDYYGCQTKRLAIAETHDLDDLVTLYPAVDVLSAMGSRVTTHPTADADFTNVPAKIMLRPSDVVEKFGQKQFVERYDIYVAADVGQLKNADILKDQNLKQYAIVSYRNRGQIDELSVIECEDCV